MIRGFILEKGMEGLSAPKIEGKLALRFDHRETAADNVVPPRTTCQCRSGLLDKQCSYGIAGRHGCRRRVPADRATIHA